IIPCAERLRCRQEYHTPPYDLPSACVPNLYGTSGVDRRHGLIKRTYGVLTALPMRSLKPSSIGSGAISSGIPEAIILPITGSVYARCRTTLGTATLSTRALAIAFMP